MHEALDSLLYIRQKSYEDEESYKKRYSEAIDRCGHFHE